MTKYNFYVPIQVRYSDLDAQWHVNNAKFMSYIEQARFEYLVKLGLFDGESFEDLQAIVADVHIAYKAPIMLGQNVRVGVRVARIGNKSLQFEYQIEDADDGSILATCENVMVAYDFHTHTSKSVSDNWRQAISAFEGLEFAN
jgi:acyl-CoA thioester hydrolase